MSPRASFRRLLESPTLWQKLLPLLGTVILAGLLVTSCTTRTTKDTAEKAAPKSDLRKTDRKAAVAQANASLTRNRLAKMGRCLLRKGLTNEQRAKCIHLTLPISQRALPGLAGKPGGRGPQGLPGIGRPGPRGPRGIPGATPKIPAPIPGPPGAPCDPQKDPDCRGPKGEQGQSCDPDRDPNCRGPQGSAGEKGAAGGQGDPGVGFDCAGKPVTAGVTPATCPGATGPQGSTGATGAAGANGRDAQPFTFSFTDATGVQHTCTIDPFAGAAAVQPCN